MADNEAGLLTETEAYRAAFYFVKQYYERGPSQAVFLMLHAMFSDPASILDWRSVIERGEFRRGALDRDQPIDGDDIGDLEPPILP